MREKMGPVMFVWKSSRWRLTGSSTFSSVEVGLSDSLQNALRQETDVRALRNGHFVNGSWSVGVKSTRVRPWS